NNHNPLPALPRWKIHPINSCVPCLEARKFNGRKFSRKLESTTSRRRSSCFLAARARGGGVAQSAMGPVYCPLDRRVYLHPAFFEDLEGLFYGCDIGSKSCQFAQAYVITHEVGHHVQNLLGILPQVQEAQRGMDQVEANQFQVRVELQADCLAGVWAHHA